MRATQRQWKTIDTAPTDDYVNVDIWLNIYASPRSMGIADSFRVIDAYRKKGKWVHIHDGKETELFEDYITHWMPIPESP